MRTIQLLATLDQTYLPRLQVLLTSIYVNQPDDSVDLYLLHSSIPKDNLTLIDKQCRSFGFRFFPVQIPPSTFRDAPVTKTYPREMYYRLLAAHLLPKQLHRVLYLDPDILVINPLGPLWDLDLKNHLFAAAAHTGKTELANSINQIRLGTDHNYFNSGVLLMDLDKGRKLIKPESLFAFAKEHGKELLLPDQDILNCLYGRHILEVDDALWNYDARNYNNYLLRSSGVCNMDWVIKNTSILHFCGKSKPWHTGYIHRFGILYKHYMQLTCRMQGIQKL